ncbi:MAG TPA: hypothetical protein VGO78_13255 [Acidimicrobiales bacterium]|nr:hypothetical protein [Acidimicrobiales bacterium]
MFAQASANNTVWFESSQAQGVRQRAERAWQARDWAGVVDAYREIIAALPAVELKPSERARVRYATARLDDPPSFSG